MKFCRVLYIRKAKLKKFNVQGASIGTGNKLKNSKSSNTTVRSVKKIKNANFGFVKYCPSPKFNVVHH